MTPRRALTLAALAAALLAPRTPAGAEDFSKWSKAADITVETTGKPLLEATVTHDVFDAAQPDLADLRIVDVNHQAVPHIIRVEPAGPERFARYEPARLYNATYVPGKSSSVTVDFGVKAKRTQVDVDTPGRNMRRLIRVEAGDDGKTWQVLRKTAWLFRIGDREVEYAKTEIPLPDNDFRYLRLTVFNASDDPEKVAIRGVRARYHSIRPAETVDVPVASQTVTENDETHVTEIALDLGWKNLPVCKLELSVREANFLRRVEVLSRARASKTVLDPVEHSGPRKRTVEVPYRHVTGGTVHRFSGADGKVQSENLALTVATRDRYLLIRIYNRDNAPLTVSDTKVRRRQYRLVAMPEHTGALKLLLGRPDADKPVYDLPHFAAQLRADGVRAATFGAVVANPDFAAPAAAVEPWTERYSWLLWVVLLAVLAGLALLVARQAKRAKAIDERSS